MTNYVIIEHCNGEISSIKELELTEEELKKYWWDEYIIIEGKILKQ